jgi:diguanylate cyclase (GGDEF)-like protein
VFGVLSNNMFPTIGDWASYPDPWGSCLKSKAGTYLLPKPNMLDEEIDAASLLNSVEDFDLAVADLGTDYRQEHWRTVIKQADLALLVSDCDEKALVRVRQFLSSKPVNKDWTLIINSRERKGYYTESQIERELSGEVHRIISLPYFPEAEQRIPKTFPPESIYLARILNLLFIEISVKENLVNKIKTPRLNFRRKHQLSVTEQSYTQPTKPDDNPAEIPVTASVGEEQLRMESREPPGKTFGGLFIKTGYIKDGEFYKFKAATLKELLDAENDLDAVVVPKSWSIDDIKNFRRDRRSKTVILVVLNGNKEHLSCGADFCINKLTPQIKQEMTLLSKKTKNLWRRVDTDPLTGLYSRTFFAEWLIEQNYRKMPFSLVMLDIDHFKQVNDAYGHDSGDAVLAAFGNFLKSNIRTEKGIDLAFRYGGEEFALVLPYTTSTQACTMVDRIREEWEKRIITLSDGRTITTTFSAGVAEWQEGCDICKEADVMLYKAKSAGRNQVKSKIPKSRILVLGKVPVTELKENGIDITYDPDQATAVICDPVSVKYAPKNKPLYVLGTDSLTNWTIKKDREEAVICATVEQIIDKLTPKLNLQVLPGVRVCNKSQTVQINGALYVVCPSRPAAAGEVAAQLVREIKNSAMLCASPESTGALSIGIPEKKLITSDWRIPGADAPVKWGGVYVWPVDPYKHIPTRYNVQSVIDQIKPKFSIVVVDCGASLDLCSRMARDEGVLLLHREGDASDIATAHWLKNHGSHNVLPMAPNEVPTVVQAENGFVISYQGISNQRNLK